MERFDGRGAVSVCSGFTEKQIKLKRAENTCRHFDTFFRPQSYYPALLLKILQDGSLLPSCIQKHVRTFCGVVHICGKQALRTTR